jgi:hypothetical protein
MTREEQLIEVMISGCPAEVKIAIEEYEAIQAAKVKPEVHVKGDLVDTYRSGDWVADVYVYRSGNSTISSVNVERALWDQRGRGLISQPEFFSRHNGLEKNATIAQEKGFSVNLATIVFTHKPSGSQTSRKVYSRKSGLSYRDDRFNKPLRREQLIASFPKAFQGDADDIVGYMEFMAPSPFVRS